MSMVYIHTWRMQNNSKARLRFTAVVNFNSKLPQHVQDINILMVTSQWEGRGGEREVEEDGGVQEGGGGRLRCTSSLYEAESK